MEKINFSRQIKQSMHGDEYYSPQNVVDMIVPHILRGGYSKIWCPFDKAESNYVRTFQRLGMDVAYGHIDTGQDFFDYDTPQGEIVVSNPPFSKRNEIFKRLYEMNVPFALVANFNGLFDSKKRMELFENNGVQILIPHGRMKFLHDDLDGLRQPSFQCVYVCNRLLENQLVFSDCKF